MEAQVKKLSDTVIIAPDRDSDRTVRTKTLPKLLDTLLRNRIPVLSPESVELKKSLIMEQAQAEVPVIRDSFKRQSNGLAGLRKWVNTIWIPFFSTALAGTLMGLFLYRENPYGWQFGASALGLLAVLVAFTGYLWLERKYSRLFSDARMTRDSLLETESLVWQRLPLEDFVVQVRADGWFSSVAQLVQKDLEQVELYVEYCSNRQGPSFLQARFGKESYYIGR